MFSVTTPSLNCNVRDTYQMDFLIAATGKAFTTVRAGLAATTTSLPNIILLPFLVAGFFLVLIMQSPGMTNLPALFTCTAPTLASASRIFVHWDFFVSVAVAIASAMPPFERDTCLAFMAFFAFMAFIAAISNTELRL